MSRNHKRKCDSCGHYLFRHSRFAGCLKEKFDVKGRSTHRCSCPYPARKPKKKKRYKMFKLKWSDDSEPGWKPKKGQR